ncbi:uncharacterized protein KQ657_000447 [Scheffersomyces spartinae]|uniref:ZZ-type domain-containing protein n=1 Tax=Scheffersomyces spartinae TaxID=45513 RepID=A0A9P8AJ31_9ASCO|nr:uncharacterized protein KQ657_000447 [Scheffersomyces spartinae]KAG7193756.1 hypothetical protein KQ657_000447 [Scheffersomyces spartinae]
MSSRKVIVSVNHTKNKQVKGVEKEIETCLRLMKQEITDKESLIKMLRNEGVYLSEKLEDVDIYRRSKKKKRYVLLEHQEDFLAMMRSLRVKNTCKLIVVDKLLDFKWLIDEKGLSKMKDVLNDYNKKLLHVCSDFISALQSELDPSGMNNDVPKPASAPISASGLAPAPVKPSQVTSDIHSEATHSEPSLVAPTVSCDGCCIRRFIPMYGTIYHCEECPDFDLCGNCYKKQDELKNSTHKSSHNMTRKTLAFSLDEKSKQVHPYISCDTCACESKPFIVGERFKCLECPDFDMCGDCVLNRDNIPNHKMGYHKLEHTMVKISNSRNVDIDHLPSRPNVCPFASSYCKASQVPFDSSLDTKEVFVNTTTENKNIIKKFFDNEDWPKNIIKFDALVEKAKRYDDLLNLLDVDGDVNEDTKFAVLQSFIESIPREKDRPVAVSIPVVEESIEEPPSKIQEKSATSSPELYVNVESSFERISPLLSRISLHNKGPSVLNGGDLSVEIYSNVGVQVYNKTINDFPPIYPGSTRKLNIDFGIEDYDKFSLYVATGTQSFNWNFARQSALSWIQVEPEEGFIVKNMEIEPKVENKDVEMNISQEVSVVLPKYESETEAQLTGNETDSPSEAEDLLKDEKNFVESVHAVILPTLLKDSTSSSTPFVDAHNEVESEDTPKESDNENENENESENMDDYDMMSSDEGESDLEEYEILSPVISHPGSQ